MYIEPSTNIRLLKGCPLDATSNHTIYFDSADAQRSYFMGLQKYNLTNYTYQRVNKGTARVGILADNIYDCNYMMFQNSAYGNKWFYAFVTSVEYVNNVTSEITFVIDDMQTWFFEAQIMPCFVVREHSATDVVGENLVEENLDLGEYVDADITGVGNLGASEIPFGNLSAVLASSVKLDGADWKTYTAGYVGGLITGLYFKAFDCSLDGANQLAEFLSSLYVNFNANDIVCLFTMPKAFVSEDIASDIKSYDISKTKYPQNFGHTGDATNPLYKPHNKKLYTYPYNFLYVSNLQGVSACFPYEYFNSDNCEFTITCDVTPNPCVLLIPKNYKGVVLNMDEKLPLNGFPQLSFNCDTFYAQLAQLIGSVGLTCLSSAVASSTASTTMTYGMWQNSAVSPESRIALQPNMGWSPAAMDYYHYGMQGQNAKIGADMAVNVANDVAKKAPSLWYPHQSKNATSGSTLAASRMLDFAFVHKQIRSEYAKIIDNYFDMYGYATNRVKVPNRNVRTQYTYTKTRGCRVRGALPAEAARNIEDIYNNGVTFWMNGNSVGNYSLGVINNPVPNSQTLVAVF